MREMSPLMLVAAARGRARSLLRDLEPSDAALLYALADALHATLEAGVYDSPEAAPSAGGDPEGVLPSESGTA